jgi:hypothetical protein
MPEASSDLPEQVNGLLRSTLDRGALRRELETLAGQSGFQELASIWAPALCNRDARFFETFLLRNLDGRLHADIIRNLLPQVEAAGHDSLFQGLYHKRLSAMDWQTRPGEWNRDILALACSPEPDERVLRAVQRREMRWSWLALTEETALALYRRNPAVFRDFIQLHVWRSWGDQRKAFPELRAAARRQGDDALSWFLFRRLADKQEWEAELRRLLHQNIPAEHLADELRKRHPEYVWDADADRVVDFLEKYGAAVLPYVEEHLGWIRRAERRLLPAVARIGDETLYWRIFFKAGHSGLWNEALRALLKQSLSTQALWREVQRRTPPEQRWSWWHLEPDVALAFYGRDPVQFRPFLERYLVRPDGALFDEAERLRDEGFLDFLSYHLLVSASHLAYHVSSSKRVPNPHPANTGVAEWERALAEISRRLIARFDRLYAQSPDVYVRHAANILSYFRAFAVWRFGHDRQHNPAFAYLITRHRDAWLGSRDGLRELLESPNIYVQIIGLELLSQGGLEAAWRVIENLPALRALLLGRARRGTKKLALNCLEQAAQQGRPFAEPILSLLETALDFRGKRALDETLIVSFVRLRRQLAQPPVAASIM